MEETFFKSALPVYDVLELDDTSLAVPADPTPRSSTRLDSDGRSLRVHQQVQLTLRRKTKKSLTNGNFDSYKLPAHCNIRNKGIIDGVKNSQVHARPVLLYQPEGIILLDWLCAHW